MIIMEASQTKIVCTMGPATSSYKTIVELIRAGMNVARLNFAHASFNEHAKMVELLTKAREELNVPLAIMVDIKGPEIRVGKLETSIFLEEEKKYFLVDACRKESLKEGEIPLRPIEVLESLKHGMALLFDDGKRAAEVLEVSNTTATIQIKVGGELSSHKSINIPEAHLNLPSVTEKDLADLEFACNQEIDMVAASFIRSAHNVLSIRKILEEKGREDLLLIAKIENKHGIENFDSIMQVADGIMVARGDLGVELDLAQVPRLQKMMIRKCFQACKPVITATQMLESMVSSPRPTRAEASDVANAIYDGTSATMLSGETAVGKYPVETVQQMRRIAKETESDFNHRHFFEDNSHRDYHDLSSAVSLASVKTAYGTNAKAIFAFTESGHTARLVSRFRPEMPIIAITPHKRVYHQLASSWGVMAIHASDCHNAKEAFRIATSFALSQEIIGFGDVVVVTAGAPFGKMGTTNAMMVANIGEVLVRGHKGVGDKVSGPITILHSAESIEPEALRGHLVVLSYCDASFLPLLKEVKGIILQNHIGDSSSEHYASLIAKTFDLSMISRADGATSILEQGEEVSMDPKKGLIYRGSEEELSSHVFSAFD